MGVYERSIRSNELMHYGILGMKWGVRRYQNSDGTLTNLGKQRLKDVDYDESTKTARKTQRSLNHLSKEKAYMDAEAATYKKKAAGTANAEKAKLYTNRGKEFLKQSKVIDDVMKKTMATAEKKGQSTSIDKEISRYMRSGEQKSAITLSTYLFGIPGWILSDAVARAAAPEREITRKKYKVTQN